MVTKAKGSSWNSLDNLGYANIKDYGAVGDGTTDCTTAIAAAIATGYPVFVPTGTFLATTIALATSTKLFGTGPNSILKVKNATNDCILTLSGLTGVEISHLSLDGNKANQSGVAANGIEVTGSGGIVLSDLYIYNTLGDGILVDGDSTTVVLDQVAINGFVKNGFHFADASKIIISNCIAYSSDAAASPGDGFAFAAAAAGDALFQVTANNCISRSNVGRGFSFLGSGSKNVYDATLSGCIAANNTSHGFHLLTTKQILLGGSIAFTNGGDGFRLEGDTVDSRVLHCTASTNTGFGIREIVSGSTPDRNDLVGMVSTGNGTNTVTKVGGSSLIPY